QVDDMAAACSLVQGVHVLGHDPRYHTGALQLGQCEVPVVAHGPVHVAPSHMVAGPVVPTECVVGQELLVGHRLSWRGSGATVVGDSGVGGDARAGQREHRAVAEDIA